MNWLQDRWDWLWYRPAEPYALAAGRMVVAYCSLVVLFGRAPRVGGLPVLNWRNLWPLEVSSSFAPYAENDPSTYVPTTFLDLLNVPPPTQFGLTVIFGIAAVGSWLLLFGLATRLSAGTVAATVLYLVAMTNSWGKVNHPYHVLGIALILLAFSRSGDVWSLDSFVRRRLGRVGVLRTDASWRYRWPVTGMQIGYALMFFFAGWNKLAKSGLEWAFSENMRNTLIYQNSLVRDWESASWVVEMAVAMDQMWVWYLFGAGALFTELGFVAIVLVFDRPWARRTLLVAGVGLVAGLELLMQLPNPVLLAMLLLFIDWNGIHRWVGEMARKTRARGGLAAVRAESKAG